MELPERPIRDYPTFWRYYLREHAKPRTRLLHLCGTGLALAALLALVLTGDPLFVLAALVAGYGPAWIAHFFVEKNQPATFSYPLWSLFSDFRMAWCWIRGQLNRELSKAGVAPSKG